MSQAAETCQTKPRGGVVAKPPQARMAADLGDEEHAG